MSVYRVCPYEKTYSFYVINRSERHISFLKFYELSKIRCRCRERAFDLINQSNELKVLQRTLIRAPNSSSELNHWGPNHKPKLVENNHNYHNYIYK